MVLWYTHTAYTGTLRFFLHILMFCNFNFVILPNFYESSYSNKNLIDLLNKNEINYIDIAKNIQKESIQSLLPKKVCGSPPGGPLLPALTLKEE